MVSQAKHILCTAVEFHLRLIRILHKIEKEIQF